MNRQDLDKFDDWYEKEFEGVKFVIIHSNMDVAAVRESNLPKIDEPNELFWVDGVWDNQATGLEAFYYNNRVDYIDEDDAVETWADYIMETPNYEGLDALQGGGYVEVHECLKYIAEKYVRPCVERAFERYTEDNR